MIALPLQKAAREKANSEFIDETFQSYVDQWAFLSTIQKISEKRLEQLISELSHGHELGELKIDEEEEKPWETHRPKIVLEKSDFPNRLDIVKANMLFIPKSGISQKGAESVKASRVLSKTQCSTNSRPCVCRPMDIHESSPAQMKQTNTFVCQRRTQQMVQHLKISTGKNLRVIVVTRPKEDFPPKDQSAMQRTLALLTDSGINVVFKSNIHQKFAVMDQKVVWYGSINLLSYGSAQESIMRIDSANIANELMKSIELT